MPLHYGSGLSSTSEMILVYIDLVADKVEAVIDRQNDGSIVSGQKKNHWYINLATSETKSIRLCPSVDQNGLLNLSVEDHQTEGDDIKNIRLSAMDGLKFSQVIELLQKNKHENYKFDRNFQGLRHWIITTLALLFSVGYLVNESEVKDAKGAVKTVWKSQDEPVQEEEQSQMVIGTFC